MADEHTEIRNLILSGGVAHDYAATSRMLAEILGLAGIVSDITDDLSAFSEQRLAGYDLITLNSVRWSAMETQGWPLEALVLNEEQQRAFSSFLMAGRGLMALHAAVISFDDWPEYGRILGG